MGNFPSDKSGTTTAPSSSRYYNETLLDDVWFGRCEGRLVLVETPPRDMGACRFGVSILEGCNHRLQGKLTRAIRGWRSIRTAKEPASLTKGPASLGGPASLAQGDEPHPVTRKLNWYYAEQRLLCKEMLEECVLYEYAILQDALAAACSGVSSGNQNDAQVFDEILRYYEKLFDANKKDMYGKPARRFVWNGQDYEREATLCDAWAGAINAICKLAGVSAYVPFRCRFPPPATKHARPNKMPLLNQPRVAFVRQKHGVKTVSRASQRNL
jgi:hypothetical protein